MSSGEDLEVGQRPAPPPAVSVDTKRPQSGTRTGVALERRASHARAAFDQGRAHPDRRRWSILISVLIRQSACPN